MTHGSNSSQRLIDSAAKTSFLEALRSGARREDAADEAGFSLTGFYGARRRDPAFKGAWEEALAATPAKERRAAAYVERGACPERSRGEIRIAGANRRFFQRRRRRHVRFDARAREAFLTHFAANCDSRAAAAAAGVCVSTVTLHCRTDRTFAAAFEEALQEGYVRLSAEALRQRLAAQQSLRAAIDAAGATARLLDEEGAEFDRIMKLLARYDRKPRRAERGFAPGGRRQRWTFEMAIEELARHLRAMGVHIPRPKAEE